MKNIIPTVMLILCSLIAVAQSANDVIGTWVNPSGEGKIRIFKTGEYYYGNLVWLKNPLNAEGKPKVDNKNPDPAKRDRKIQGLLILTGFVYDATDKEWINGQIYDPKNGKMYSCKMSISGSDKLSIRGFIGISLIGRSEV